MNLTELQTELRSMEKRLVELQLEVERMKPRQEVEKKKDYETITRLARVYPLENVELKSAQGEYQKAVYPWIGFSFAGRRTGTVQPPVVSLQAFDGDWHGLFGRRYLTARS